MKWLRRSLLILAALLVLTAAGLALWLRSEGALHWALDFAQQRTKGALRIGSSEGSLARPVLLRDVEWDSGPLRVHVDTLRLEWRPLASILGRAQLSEVQAEHVQVLWRSSGKPVTFPMQMPGMPPLPLKLILEDVRVQDLDVDIGSLPPVRIDTARFAARVDDDGIVVRELQATGPVLSAAGRVTLAPNHDWAVDAALDWTWKQPGWATLKDHTELKGDDRLLTVRDRLAAPYGSSVDGTLKDAFTAPHWQGELGLSRMELGDIRPGLPDYGADARLKFQGDQAGTVFRGEAALRGLPVGPVAAKLDASVLSHKLEFRSLLLALTGGGQVQAAGDVSFDTGTRSSFTGTWKDLTWPVDAPKFSSPEGRFKLDGDKQFWRADLDGALAPDAKVQAKLQLARDAKHSWTVQATAQGLKGEALFPKKWMERALPSGDWQLAAHGDVAGAQLDSLAGDWLGGSLSVDGRYLRGDVDTWRAHAVITDAGAGRLSRDWPGKLSGVVDADGSFGGARHATPQTQVILETLHGSLRGNPLDAKGEVSFSGAQWQELALDAKLGEDTLHVDTDTRGNNKLHWRLDAPTLAQAWPDAAGELHSHGTLESGNHTTLLDFALDGKQLAWHRWAADSLHFALQAGSDGEGKADLLGVNLTVPGLHVPHLDAHADGKLDQHHLDVTLQSDRGGLHLAGTGSYAAGHWQGDLSKVVVTPQGGGEWRAPSSWSLTLAPHVLDLKQACLVQDQSRACAGLAADAAAWHLQGKLQHLPLAALSAVLPQGLEYSGSVDGALQADGGAQGHRIVVDATLSPGRVRDLAGGKPVTLLAYTGGEAHMRSDPKLTVGKMSWTLTDGGSLQVDTRMSFGAKPSLSGRIRGDMHDFALLPALVPQVSKASGRLDLDIGLSGTPADPLFEGTTTLSDGVVAIPRLGLNLTGLQFTLAGDGRHLDLAGSAHSGKGLLSFKGSGDRSAKTWHAKAQLQGADFRSLDLLEAQVDLSPDIQVALDGRDIHVDGKVDVPHAVLKPRNLSGTLQVSPDQVIVGEEGGAPEEAWHLHSKLRVTLGDDVHFEGFGLTGDIGGEVLAETEPGHPTTGRGELNVQNGSYEVNLLKSTLNLPISQKLSIEYGKLMFTGGPITDPALDMRAVRAASHPELVKFGTVEQKVGVLVRGLLTAPSITLWADPPLPQAQMVSYLVTGNASLGEGSSAVANTPGVITQSSLSGVSAQSNQDLGLNVGGIDVSYQSIQTSNGSVAPGVFVGKQLSPHLYLRYGQASDQPYNVLQIIYKLSTQWMVQAQSGTASSADIFYTIEH
ncbi:MAG TPA: translocation/assembly module TamB domain-containing protein [Gammaproteobacteria bacterium]